MVKCEEGTDDEWTQQGATKDVRSISIALVPLGMSGFCTRRVKYIIVFITVHGHNEGRIAPLDT